MDLDGILFGHPALSPVVPQVDGALVEEDDLLVLLEQEAQPLDELLLQLQLGLVVYGSFDHVLGLEKPDIVGPVKVSERECGSANAVGVPDHFAPLLQGQVLP